MLTSATLVRTLDESNSVPNHNFTTCIRTVAQIKNTRVMIVDDFEPLQKMIRRALEIDGFVQIETASDGEEAVALSREFRPDIVIMDHSLEVMNGLEATRAIKSELPNTAVIALTGLSTPSLVLDYFRAGALSFASKPIQLDHLLHIVRKAVPA